MYKLYHVTGYDKQHICLVVIFRYPVLLEYIALFITNQEMMEIVFVMIAPPENNLDLYIDANVKNPSQESSLTPNSSPSFRGMTPSQE